MLSPTPRGGRKGSLCEWQWRNVTANSPFLFPLLPSTHHHPHWSLHCPIAREGDGMCVGISSRGRCLLSASLSPPHPKHFRIGSPHGEACVRRWTNVLEAGKDVCPCPPLSSSILVTNRHIHSSSSMRRSSLSTPPPFSVALALPSRGAPTPT